MPREVHEDTDDYTIEWDDEIDAVIHTWKDYTSGAEFREGAESLLDVIKERNASKVLVDTSAIRAHDDEDQAWLQRDWTPRALEAGVEYTAMIHPDSVIAEMDLESMMEDMEELDIEREPMMTSDVAEARQWLAEK